MTFNPTAQGSSVNTKHINNSGGSLLKTTPTRVNASGELDTIDVSIESHVESIIGVILKDSNNGNPTEIVYVGVIEDIISPFSFGDRVFLSKTGGLTNIKPDVGVGGFVAGDFVVSIGIITKNIDNPIKKDLVISIENRGQLA